MARFIPSQLLDRFKLAKFPWPLGFGVSYLALFGIFIHIILLIAVGVVDYQLDASGEIADDLIKATGNITLMNFWMAIFPTVIFCIFNVANGLFFWSGVLNLNAVLRSIF